MALVVDCETTGLEAEDEIIELAMRPLTFRPADGVVVGVHGPYVGLQQPSRPLSDEVAQLVGLDGKDLDGRSIDLSAVEAMVADAALIIAHSARFDRPFLERLSPVFVVKPWACSIEDADWQEEGIESAKLAFVAAFGFSFFFDAHRALDDCDAVCACLAGRAPRTGVPMLGKILMSARRGRWRVRIFDTQYETRGFLKARRWLWSPESARCAKHWFKDVKDRDDVERERAAVSDMRGARFEAVHLDAYVRFSARG